MKPKRKSILLVTLLVTIFIVVAIVNLTNVMGNKDVLRNTESPNQAALEKAMARNKANVAKKEAGSLTRLQKTSEGAGMTGAAVSGIKGEIPERASIEIPFRTSRKPVYENGRVAGQWYTEDSYEKTNAEKKTTGDTSN